MQSDFLLLPCSKGFQTCLELIGQIIGDFFFCSFSQKTVFIPLLFFFSTFSCTFSCPVSVPCYQESLQYLIMSIMNTLLVAGNLPWFSLFIWYKYLVHRCPPQTAFCLPSIPTFVIFGCTQEFVLLLFIVCLHLGILAL